MKPAQDFSDEAIKTAFAFLNPCGHDTKTNALSDNELQGSTSDDPYDNPQSYCKTQSIEHPKNPESP